MAIQTNSSDSHLYSVSTDFLASNVPYSISVWINAIWNGGNRLSFVGMYDGTVTGGTTTGLQIGTSTGAGELSCWTYGGTLMVNSSTGVMTPYNNTWVFVVYTYDGTTHRIYLNDVLLNSSTTTPVTGTFTQVYINGYPPTGTANETSSFEIDTYAYYGRTLSQPEIQTMYNCRGFRHGIVYSQIARYEFEELADGSTATNVVDVSDNGNNLINTGSGSPLTYVSAGTVATSNLR